MSEEVKVIRWSKDEEINNNAIERDSSAENEKKNSNATVSNPEQQAFTTIHVLHLSRPLVGGVDAPDSSEEVAEVICFIKSCGAKCAVAADKLFPNNAPVSELAGHSTTLHGRNQCAP